MLEVSLQAFTIDMSVSMALAATAHLPQSAHDVGVVFVTGGHQTRSGSHRQFLKLARRFAGEGFPCVRFDLAGLGDSEGKLRHFDDNGLAIRAAIDALIDRVPTVSRIVLWGLCDGATAAALYANSDARVVGLILANPWVRTWQVQAQTLVRTYYRRRLMSRDFWLKLLRGEVGVVRSGKEWFTNWRLARSDRKASDGDLPARLQKALGAFSGATQIIIAEQDLTGQEFRLVAQSLDEHPAITIACVGDADHTFSTQAWHQQLALLSLNALAAVLPPFEPESESAMESEVEATKEPEMDPDFTVELSAEALPDFVPAPAENNT